MWHLQTVYSNFILLIISFCLLVSHFGGEKTASFSQQEGTGRRHREGVCRRDRVPWCYFPGASVWFSDQDQRLSTAWLLHQTTSISYRPPMASGWSQKSLCPCYTDDSQVCTFPTPLLQRGPEQKQAGTLWMLVPSLLFPFLGSSKLVGSQEAGVEKTKIKTKNMSLASKRPDLDPQVLSWPVSDPGQVLLLSDPWVPQGEGSLSLVTIRFI